MAEEEIKNEEEQTEDLEEELSDIEQGEKKKKVVTERN